MTKEIAIHNLFALKLRSRVTSDREALDMAIKALEQQSFDGKTNGDVIKALFPSAKIFIDERSAYRYVYVNNPNMGASWKIREDWWNAPYKAESEEEE